VLIGGLGYLDTLYRLSSLDSEWELLPQKLKIGRYQHTAFLIDKELTTCT